MENRTSRDTVVKKTGKKSFWGSEWRMSRNF